MPGHPLLTAVFTESMRALTRHHLRQLPRGQELLERLSGKVIALRLEPFGKRVYLCPTHEDLQFLTELSRTPDVTISGNLAAFVQAGLLGKALSSLNEAGLGVAGDADLARQFHALSQALKIDWQRVLESHLGWPLAHSIMAAARAGSAWTHATLRAAQDDVSEYLREEARWLPDRAETEAFYNAVDTLREVTDRLSARISRLESSGQPLPQSVLADRLP